MDLHKHERFMLAAGQTVGMRNPGQMKLYISLIEEELQELRAAMAAEDKVATFDAVLDLLVVTVGAGLSEFSVDQLEAGWWEVCNSNASKLDPITGRVIRRDDGKILKGPDYRPPALKHIAMRVSYE